MPIQIEMGFVWLAFSFQESRRFLQECNAQGVRTGFDRNPDVKVLVDQVVTLTLWRGRHREQLDALTIQSQFELMRLGETLDLLITIACKPKLYPILGIQRKRIVCRRSSACTERQFLEMLLLCQVRRNQNGIANGRTNRTSDCQPADLSSSRQIALQQRGREISGR